jgi:hypothetical protein
MAVQKLADTTPKPSPKKPAEPDTDVKQRAKQHAEEAHEQPTAEKPGLKGPEPEHRPVDPNRQFAPHRPPSGDAIREGNIAAKLGRQAPVLKRAGVAGEEPLKGVKSPKGGYYGALEDGDPTAGFIASHGTWQNWVSNIKTPDGPRGVHETKLVPCDCDLCKRAIEEKGWTF